MKFHPYFSKLSQINMLENWILVQCFAYYVFDRPSVSDNRYDENAKQLRKLIDSEPAAFKESKYRKVFEGFEPSTGFDLVKRLEVMYPKKYYMVMGQASYLVNR